MFRDTDFKNFPRIVLIFLNAVIEKKGKRI